ncbi:MAG: CAP domain-containing protein [Pleurocapsa sp.]
MYRLQIFLPTPRLVKATVTVALVIGGVFYSSSSVASEATSLKQNSMMTAASSSSEKSEFTNLVQQVHQQINQYRGSLNLAPLSLNALISEQAKIHSQQMAQQLVKLGHQGFEARIEALEADLAARSAAENVAYNQGYRNPADRAVIGWIKSETHRQNIVGNYNLTGIGIAQNQQGEYYFTQIFILEN